VPVKLFFGDVAKFRKLVDSRIIHENVELAVDFPGFGKNSLHVRGDADIALDCGRFAGRLNDLPTRRSAPSVIIHHDRSAARGEAFRNCHADAFRCTGDGRCFVG
jgi:hypothetical protein